MSIKQQSIKHAILLASKDWCEAAASGSIKVYDFIKPRRMSIRALRQGSVCVIITKAESGQPPVFMENSQLPM